MKKEFCTYEQSIALKELGFDGECFGYYVIDEYDGFFYTFTFKNDGDKKRAAAPLIQQAFRFFREKYNILFEIGISSDESDNDLFISIIYPFEKEHIYLGEYLIYEEAEQACLNKLIELAKEK